MRLFVIFFCLYFLHSGEVLSQSKVNWIELDNNTQINNNGKKMIIDLYTDWCGWCKRLVKEVFDQKEFKDWAKDKIIPVELDFPRRTKLDENLVTQNRQLQRLFAVQGYPTIWLVRPQYQEENKVNFEKLGKTGYVRGGVSNWIQSAEQFLN